VNTLKFEDLPLSKHVLKAIAKMGYSEATPIQSSAIPLIADGKDVTGLAMTGTGKTAAFALPLIDKINPADKCIQALIICPTRELAMQVSGEITKFLAFKKEVSVLPVYGGQPIERQMNALRRGVHIIVSTPGRLMDHINRRSISLKNVTCVVLDEADEMMDMGFRKDIEKILQSTPTTRQTVTFSATMPTSVLQLIKKYQKNPELIQVSSPDAAADTVEQHYYEVDNRNKVTLLKHILKNQNPYLSLVFCNTKYKVDEIAKRLQQHGILTESLHGNVSQPKRNRVMKKFRSGDVQVVVATDVAARGIDVPNIDIIFNYDIPKDEKSYVHRIGRTGRAGKSGHAISFVSPQDAFSFRHVKRCIETTITQQKLPFIQEPSSEQYKDNSHKRSSAQPRRAYGNFNSRPNRNGSKRPRISR